MLIYLFLVSLLFPMIFSQGPKTCFRLNAVKIRSKIDSTHVDPELHIESLSKIYLFDECPSPTLSCVPMVKEVNCGIKCGSQAIGKCESSVHASTRRLQSTSGQADSISAGKGKEPLTVEVDCTADTPVQQNSALYQKSDKNYDITCDSKIWTYLPCTPLLARASNSSSSRGIVNLAASWTCRYGCVKEEAPYFADAGTVTLSVEGTREDECDQPTNSRNMWMRHT